MKIDVTYSRDTLIAAVGPSVWAKLGPEKWFDNYRIVAADSRGYHADFVRDLGITAHDTETFTTQYIIEQPAFRELVKAELPDYRFIVYKPVRSVEGIDSATFIANDVRYARFEDKKIFRELFAESLPMPQFDILPMEALLEKEPGPAYDSLVEKFGSRFVVQDNKNSGGRGTFIIASPEDMARCQAVLRKERLGTHLVISRFIAGIERSIQVFVSHDQILRGPLQQQLLRNPELLDPQGRGGMYFCGGRFLSGWSDKVEEQVAAIIETVGGRLRSEGYRGIFGIDFLLDEAENISVLEVNARTTGLLPLLNEQTVGVPLYLLHILELAKEDYAVQNADDLHWRAGIDSGPASFVVLYNATGADAWFDETVTTGNYTWREGALHQLDDRARWNDQADVMLQLFCAPDSPALPNVKLTNIFLKKTGFSDNGELSDEAREIVTYLKRHIVG